MNRALQGSELPAEARKHDRNMKLREITLHDVKNQMRSEILSQ